MLDAQTRLEKLAQAIGKWRRRQPDHMRRAGFDLVDPHGHLHVGPVDHEISIGIRPLAFGQRFSAGNLKRASGRQWSAIRTECASL